MAKEKKPSKDLKGWQILLIAIAFHILGLIVSGAVGGLLIISSVVFFGFSIAAFIREARTKKES
ncbi:MAG: hypothetical protein WBP12_01870 [Candidatus Saccharimonas sp.]